ncbi:hypothetical protein SLS53_001873 [Cytospora paraplurivora]|uniref:Uncharacterized protein n=1 Tax=Cytospora paraplurivora TaxID=2898453 RepID=A0AAN9YKZ8_9PEZI
MAANTSSTRGSFRVVWPASRLVDTSAPKPRIPTESLEHLASAKDTNYIELYSMSKVGTWFLASESARCEGTKSGVLYIAGNPDTCNTNMWQYTPTPLYLLVRPLLRNPVPHGVDTYLWTVFFEFVTLEDAEAVRYGMCNR